MWMQLEKREILRLPGDGVVVCCVAGTLWLTRDGGIEDIVLEAGQAHRLQGGAPHLVQALAPSRLRLTCYQPAAIESGDQRGSRVTAPRSTNSIWPIGMVCSCAMVRGSQPALGSPCT
jgi:hypothetical protein